MLPTLQGTVWLFFGCRCFWSKFVFHNGVCAGSPRSRFISKLHQLLQSSLLNIIWRTLISPVSPASLKRSHSTISRRSLSFCPVRPSSLSLMPNSISLCTILKQWLLRRIIFVYKRFVHFCLLDIRRRSSPHGIPCRLLAVYKKYQTWLHLVRLYELFQMEYVLYLLLCKILKLKPGCGMCSKRKVS